MTARRRVRPAAVVAALLGAGLVSLAGCVGGGQTDAAPKQPAGDVSEAASAGADTAAPAVRLPVAPAAEEPDCLVIVDAEPDYGGPPLTVQFETEVDCTAGPVHYEWDFGDGEKGTGEAHPRHVYSKAGDYVATVRISAPDGGKSDDDVDITVDDLFHE